MKICRYCSVVVCQFYLCSLSWDAAKSPWMCGLYFQSSLLGGGSSLMLDALAIFEGLPVLLRTTSMSQRLLLCQLHSWTHQYWVYGYVLHQWANLHVFHQVFRTLHQNYSLKRWMLTHHSTNPIHSYNKLREDGLTNGPNSTLTEVKCLGCDPTCIDLSYQRFAPFFSKPPPCSIIRALLVSLGSKRPGSSRHTTHRQLSIRARDSLLVWSEWKQVKFWIILLRISYSF